MTSLTHDTKRNCWVFVESDTKRIPRAELHELLEKERAEQRRTVLPTPTPIAIDISEIEIPSELDNETTQKIVLEYTHNEPNKRFELFEDAISGHRRNIPHGVFDRGLS